MRHWSFFFSPKKRPHLGHSLTISFFPPIYWSSCGYAFERTRPGLEPDAKTQQ
ncbi:hypothetical protein BC828DRAFT_389008 [Blastocladiella britannica]|nr:hypothetical protein BC828DRAFT_389008 [Blastocladiella britannica]